MTSKPSFQKYKWTFAIIATVIVVLAIIIHRSAEPEYDGKKLSEYLDALDARHPSYHLITADQVDHALRQMGDDALSHFVEMLHAEDTIPRGLHIYLYRNASWLNLNQPLTLGEIHWRGGVGLARLGHAGHSAIPQLIPLLDHPDAEMRKRAIWLLDTVGMEDAALIPILQKAFHDPSPPVVEEALDIVARRKTAASSILPLNTPLLQHPDARVRDSCTRALIAAHPQATNEIKPVLHKVSSDTDSVVRGNALMQFIERESDESIRQQVLTRFLSDPDVSIRFKVTNLLRSISFTNSVPAPVWPQSFAMNDIPLGDFLYVLQHNFGVPLQVSPGLNTSTPIRIDTYGFLPKAESIELLRLVLKEQAGLDLHIHTNGVISLTPIPLPGPRKPVP
ncbi:MAG TPA: HEAT repeat domain-containing protein [Verrucomicrobiae bacterium]